MILVDTSVWVHILRDTSGGMVQDFRKKIAEIRPLFHEFYHLTQIG
ncbi:MAG: hypothetical protein JW932_17835 [Deltaproteobacteria bacterium]|nr:hypothetical protein [Deltaproteobacteria bacterium]